jgi:ribosomal protein S18 acetylase RimI-like enzyme
MRLILFIEEIQGKVIDFYYKCLPESGREFESMYLLSKYHKNGLGQKIIDKAFDYANNNVFKEMYLDSLSSSEGAIRLYKKNGFIETARYNDNMIADVFMKRIIE